MKALTKRLIGLGVAGAIAVSGAFLVEPWESTKNQAYKDMVGIPTICAGYTIGVKMGDYKTDEECEELLAKELTYFNTQMMKSVKVSLPEHMEVAYTSLVWNIGVGAWNSSTLLKKINSNDLQGACEGILAWNKATFKKSEVSRQQSRGEVCSIKRNGDYACTVKGLTNRREAEYKVCMGENADINKALHELSLSNEEPLSVDENALKTIEIDEVVHSPQLNETNVSSHHTTATRACLKQFLGTCIRYEH